MMSEQDATDYYADCLEARIMRDADSLAVALCPERIFDNVLEWRDEDDKWLNFFDGDAAFFDQAGKPFGRTKFLAEQIQEMNTRSPGTVYLKGFRDGPPIKRFDFVQMFIDDCLRKMHWGYYLTSGAQRIADRAWTTMNLRDEMQKFVHQWARQKGLESQYWKGWVALTKLLDEIAGVLSLAAPMPGR
jgi:hypothetical protein